MKTQSWITRMAFAGIAASLTLFAAGAPSAAQAMSVNQRESVDQLNANQRMSVDETSMYRGDHHGDHHQHSGHHYGGRPHGFYYIYPYTHIYRYYPAPTYPTPTYWYYCPSYATYYPYVASCPDAWVPVPAS